MDSRTRQARTAGVLYALVALTGPIGLVYVPNHLFVPGDALATAAHLRASEPLLRLGIASELFHQAIEVFLVVVLYGLFKPVSTSLARQMAALGLLPIPIMFLNVLNEIAALTLVSGAGYLKSFGAPQLDTLAMLFVRLHQQGLQVAAIFWGLWLIPLGLLIRRCGFIPRLLGVSVMLAAAGYLLGAFTVLITPRYASAIADVAGMLEVFELPIIFWLLIWGARSPAPDVTQAPIPG
jgi:hypothetical protein